MQWKVGWFIFAFTLDSYTQFSKFLYELYLLKFQLAYVSVWMLLSQLLRRSHGDATVHFQ